MSSTHITMDARISWPSLVILVTVVTTAGGSAIEFTTTANPIRPPLSTNLTLRCSLKDTALNEEGISSSTVDLQKEEERCKKVINTTINVPFVTSVAILKNGVELATLSEHFPAKSVIISPGLLVTGSLSGQAGERGFLQLNWQHPTTEQAGEYKCDIDGLEKEGSRVYFSTALQIKEANISLRDLINRFQENEIDKDKIKASLNRKLEKMNQTISMMNSTIINLIKSEAKQHVFFSAGVTTMGSQGTVGNGQVVVFDRQFSSIGGGYNNKTGVFTCPLAGFYNFNVNLLTWGSKSIYCFLKHNNQKVLYIRSSAGNSNLVATNSATVKLNIGDTVKVVSDSGTTEIWSQAEYVTSTFSGNLLATV